MRRLLTVAAIAVILPLITGAGCNKKNSCPDDSEASAVSVSSKPTCKPVNRGPRWVEPSFAGRRA